MSYLGFSKLLVRDFLTNFNSPKVLEIGLDAGQTTLPMLHNMAVHFDEFTYVGIDVSVNNLLIEQIGQLSGIHLKGVDKNPGNKNVEIYEANSLEWLYSNINQERIYENYDLVMIDGDHNYYTVFNELTMLEDLTHDHTLIVCDDYQGRYSDKDLFYIERDTHAGNKHLKKPVRLERQGVGRAINDYISRANGRLASFAFGPLDPCFICNPEFIEMKTITTGDRMRESIVKFTFKDF
jgi:predicted O-methyltransferase YrrM